MGIAVGVLYKEDMTSTRQSEVQYNGNEEKKKTELKIKSKSPMYTSKQCTSNAQLL